MNYWLMKSEPDVFGIDHLKAMPNKTEHWDGVRNYQARNMMRDDMKKGDLVFFYHSNCKVPGIVGIAEVVKEGYVDFTAFDPDTKYYDPKSDPQNPPCHMVDTNYKRHPNPPTTRPPRRRLRPPPLRCPRPRRPSRPPRRPRCRFLGIRNQKPSGFSNGSPSRNAGAT